MTNTTNNVPSVTEFSSTKSGLSKKSQHQQQPQHQQHQQTSGTLVSLNIIDFKPSQISSSSSSNRRQRATRTQQKQQQQQQQPQNQQIAKKSSPPESRLVIIEEHHQNKPLSQQQQQAKVGGVWPLHHDHIMDSNSMSTAAWTSSTTGVMSDRSSVYSIDDGGDFDREASHKVNKQLKEIEAILYEQIHSTVHHNNNLNECKEWLHKFPHLRY